VPRTIAFACTSCGNAVEGPLAPSATCPRCGVAIPLSGTDALLETGGVAPCPVCGGADLYQQRDFSRRLGLALAAIGLLAGPFTQWISTVVAVVIDAALYLLVPVVTICYACEAQQRGVEKAHLPEKFEIAIHDTYRFGKRHPPRREAAVAGPRARLLAREGKIPT
jgi:predicted RNA-binding Zn-ribbon protein involved in translation (DUF1610 family)